jgi:hypothetical protein
VTNFNHAFIIADISPPADQTSNFDYCIKIINLDQYPNYRIFVNVGRQNEDPQKVDREYMLAKSDRCIPLAGYRPEARIAAIPKDLVKPQDSIERNGAIFIQNLKIEKVGIRSSTTIQRPYSLPIIYAGSKVEDSVKIDKLDRQNLIISVLNRSPIELAFKSPIWLVLPLIGAVGLGWLIFRKRRKKSSERK